MDDSQKVRYMNGLIVRLVRQIQDLQEDVAAPAVYGKDVSANTVADRLDAMLQIEDPGGKTGTLSASEDGWSIMLDARVTGMRVISTRTRSPFRACVSVARNALQPFIRQSLSGNCVNKE